MSDANKNMVKELENVLIRDEKIEYALGRDEILEDIKDQNRNIVLNSRKNITKDSPNVKVGLVTFNSDVTIYGDCLSKPIKIDMLENNNITEINNRLYMIENNKITEINNKIDMLENNNITEINNKLDI